MNASETKTRPWIVLVGGFLGAGKTSLILSAARMLENRGIRSAAILNDQGNELVDTRQAELRGARAREVTGGCFCCRYSRFHSAIQELRTHASEVIFAEPVGSCTDLVATVLGPLREEFDFCRVAPFTVLVDPARAAELQAPGADPHMQFLWQKQIEEADLVCLAKADRYPDARPLPGVPIRRISAKTGLGVDAWLRDILGDTLSAGANPLEIDYERYASAEAALAWMNLSLRLEVRTASTPASVVGPLLEGLDASLAKADTQIVHLKLIDRSATGWLKAAICAHGEDPVIEGDLDASPSCYHDLLLNLRAVGDPLRVETIVRNRIALLHGNVSDLHLDCFSPLPPRPERRIVKAHLESGGRGSCA